MEYKVRLRVSQPFILEQVDVDLTEVSASEDGRVKKFIGVDSDAIYFIDVEEVSE